MKRGRGFKTLFIPLVVLYFVSLADLEVFGDLIGFSGEREATEQLSLIVVMSAYIFSCISCFYSSDRKETAVYVGYIATSLSIYISEVGILTAKARPVIGILIIGFVVVMMFRNKVKVSTFLFITGIALISISTMVDLILEGLLGYFGEGSELRRAYLERSTLDLEEIIEPAAYLSVLASCWRFSGEIGTATFKMGVKSGMSILFSSVVIGIGHTFLIFSNSRLETLVGTPLIYAGLILSVFYFYNEIDTQENMHVFATSILILSVTFTIAIPPLSNSSDIISLFMVLPFVVYFSFHLMYSHPHTHMITSSGRK